MEEEECCNEQGKEVLQREWERATRMGEAGGGMLQRARTRSVATRRRGAATRMGEAGGGGMLQRARKRGVATRMEKARHDWVLQRECDKREDECCNEQGKGNVLQRELMGWM